MILENKSSEDEVKDEVLLFSAKMTFLSKDHFIYRFMHKPIKSKIPFQFSFILYGVYYSTSCF